MMVTAGKRGEQIGAGVGQLVEEKRAAADLGENGEQARAGRGLQHDVGQRDRCRRHRRKAEWRGCRELLHRLALFGAAGVRRQQAGDLRQGGEPRSRRRGFAEKRLSVFAEEEDGRGLAGVVGGFPAPRARGVGGVESGLHRSAQDRGVDALAAFEMAEEVMGRREDGGRRATGATGAVTGRMAFMKETFRRAGTGKPGGALSRPPGLNPSRPPLPLKGWPWLA
jgi:hypothetical protein